jgi:hypothetical protein
MLTLHLQPTVYECPPKGGLFLSRAERIYTTILLRPEYLSQKLAQAAYARRVLLQGKRIEPCHYRFIRKALERIAGPIGGLWTGRPILWRPK